MKNNILKSSANLWIWLVVFWSRNTKFRDRLAATTARVSAAEILRRVFAVSDFIRTAYLKITKKITRFNSFDVRSRNGSFWFHEIKQTSRKLYSLKLSVRFLEQFWWQFQWTGGWLREPESRAVPAPQNMIISTNPRSFLKIMGKLVPPKSWLQAWKVCENDFKDLQRFKRPRTLGFFFWGYLERFFRINFPIRNTTKFGELH